MLTKQQKKIIEELMNDGCCIWQVGGTAYLAAKDKDGRVTSSRINAKTFTKFLCEGIVEQGEDKRWRLKK